MSSRKSKSTTNLFAIAILINEKCVKQEQWLITVAKTDFGASNKFK